MQGQSRNRESPVKTLFVFSCFHVTQTHPWQSHSSRFSVFYQDIPHTDRPHVLHFPFFRLHFCYFFLCFCSTPSTAIGPPLRLGVLWEAHLPLSRIQAQVGVLQPPRPKPLRRLNRARGSSAIVSKTPWKQARHKNSIEVATLNRVLGCNWTLKRSGPQRQHVRGWSTCSAYSLD